MIFMHTDYTLSMKVPNFKEHYYYSYQQGLTFILTIKCLSALRWSQVFSI